MSALAASACALGTLSGAAGQAHASTSTYWHPNDVASLGREPSGSKYNLRSSIAWSNSSYRSNAGAHYPGGTSLYANWAEGWGFACHPYAAGQTLGAMLRNPHTITIEMRGDVNFDANVC